MGKLENNKQQKRTSLLDTAFKLFTTQGVSKTSIAEISQKAGIAKGTFYLYFKDKYDIRNKLVSHEASKLFKNAVNALELHIKELAPWLVILIITARLCKRCNHTILISFGKFLAYSNCPASS